MGFLKGKSSILIHGKHGNPRYKMGTRVSSANNM